MRTDSDPIKLTWQELEVVRYMRLTTPEMKEITLQMAITYAELFPLRPTLRLVKSDAGGSK